MQVTAVFSIRRLKSTAVLFGVIAIALLAAAVAKSRAAKSAIIIKMVDTPSFEPARTTIKVGDTVEWQNVGSQLHHVTTDPGAALKKADVATPPGAKPFDSGFLKPGESFSETFSVPGIYRYTCAVHEAKGMNGQVVVEK
jgi:plastocyanin